MTRIGVGSEKILIDGGRTTPLDAGRLTGPAVHGVMKHKNQRFAFQLSRPLALRLLYFHSTP